ncbi:MAG: flagellar hook-length control protein FliK [Eubacteriales bacterium]|nr:flagellar hook-length control protein FliK [Eubacteriales bacterium]
MNIENSLGMLFSNEISATAAAGNGNGLAVSQGENPEGSLFQQLISQMMMTKNPMQEAADTKNPMTDAAGANGSGKKQGKPGETANPLSELLLAGGGFAKIRLLSTEQETGESTPGDGQTAEPPHAFIAGFGNPVQTANPDKNLSDPQPVRAAAEVPVSGISSVQETGNDFETTNPHRSDIPGDLKTASGDRTEMTSATTNEMEAEPAEMSAAGREKAVPRQGNTAQQPEAPILTTSTVTGGSEKSATPAPKENDLLSIQKNKPVNGKTGKPEVMAAQNYEVPETGKYKQNTAAGSHVTKTTANPIASYDTADAAEKTKPELEPKGAGPERIGFQNVMQGTAGTRETAEAILPGQTVESSQPYSQIKDEILAKLEQSGPTEFKMQLDPEDLGQIDIKLKLSEGKLIIDILAANTKTQALLTGQVDKLIASMGLQNVTVESVQVNQQMNSQAQDGSQNQGYTRNAAMDFSQRKQQEQYQQQILNDGKLTETFDRQPDETQTNQQNRIESMRYESHRMNYAV